MEYRLFDTPPDYGFEWHKDRAVADHVHEPGHRARILEVVAEVLALRLFYPSALSVVDLACGNGGLLGELATKAPQVFILKGFDISEASCQYARDVYGMDAKFADITSGETPPANIAILSEILEHLVSPRDFLTSIKEKYRWIVASSPAYESPSDHYEFHTWAWTGKSFSEMFEEAGYEVVKHYEDQLSTQFVVARPKE